MYPLIALGKLINGLLVIEWQPFDCSSGDMQCSANKMNFSVGLR